jgi:hypothetical protein
MGFAITSVLPSWLHRRTVGGAAEQSSHWQAFRKAALGTPFYKRNPIARASVVELADFYAQHAEFLNPGAEIPPPVSLTAVWDPLPAKTVAVKPWFRLQAPVETILEPAQVSTKGWDVLAAPVIVLMALAARRPMLPSPAYGIVAFTGISQPPLTRQQRDALWATWRTPVFEQFRGFQGELLAAECEAFAGLHFDQEVAIWEGRSRESGELLVTSLANLRHPAWRLATGWRGRVEHGACDCGSPLPRVVWD